MIRRHLSIKGVVQGVGFRPFAYNLANRLGVSGWVGNSSDGVEIEIQGDDALLERFVFLLQAEKPVISQIESIESLSIPPSLEEGFVIQPSQSKEYCTTIALPDLATCDDCLREVMSPENRRYRYPFTNCTKCGPRFSIIERLPYDRKNTTMQRFVMCPACMKEYENPLDRRFHAQPNACPDCGPQLYLTDSAGNRLGEKNKALLNACKEVKKGAILALKGIGGFQLIVDASNGKSITALRLRKNRPDKPFALMFPSLKHVKRYACVSEEEEKILLSPQAPIVLLKSKQLPASNIAPNNPYVGALLPYSPLHHLIAKEINVPFIATSGNRAEEPICIDEEEALSDLNGIADFFLMHDRPISRYVDDSVVQAVLDEKQIIRRSRGYSSMPIAIDSMLPPALAVGAQMKNTFAASKDNKVYLSQYIGDLENLKAEKCYSRETGKLLDFYGISPEIVIADMHPGYSSTQFAKKLNKPTTYCQHHIAHVYSCMAENRVEPPLLGVSWDGTGYGMDGLLWGGEFFIVEKDYSSRRIASFKPFLLPCGEKAAREPRLSAIGMLYEIFGAECFNHIEYIPINTFSEMEVNNLKQLFLREFQTIKCTSVGRIFDAVTSLTGIMHQSTFEGQAAMQLEFLCPEQDDQGSYPFKFLEEPLLIDWEPMVRQILIDVYSSLSVNRIAEKFHNTLTEIIVSMTGKLDQSKVVLTGGVFQNRVLTRKVVAALKKISIQPYWHKEVPPNDGGISLGQIFSLKNGLHRGNSK